MCLLPGRMAWPLCWAPHLLWSLMSAALLATSLVQGYVHRVYDDHLTVFFPSTWADRACARFVSTNMWCTDIGSATPLVPCSRRLFALPTAVCLDWPCPCACSCVLQIQMRNTQTSTRPPSRSTRQPTVCAPAAAGMWSSGHGWPGHARHLRAQPTTALALPQPPLPLRRHCQRQRQPRRLARWGGKAAAVRKSRQAAAAAAARKTCR